MVARLRRVAPVAIGVLAGLLVVGSLIGVLVVSAPDPAARATARTFPPVSPTLTAAATETVPTGPSSAATATPPGSLQVGLRPGDLAPPLVVEKLGGGTFDLAATRGKAVWVYFMQSTCPPCRDELPLINDYAARLADKGLVVVGIDITEPREVAAAFAQEMGVPFVVGIDPDGASRRYWETFVMPVHFWVDRDGIVSAFAFGGIGRPQMEEGLGKVLPGVPLAP